MECLSLIQAIKTLHNSQEFKEWKISHPQSFLAHAFMMLPEHSQAWQIGYHNPNTTITPFIVRETVEIGDEEEIFKHEDTTIQPLIEEEILLDSQAALNLGEKLMKEKYGAHTISKTILLAQKTDHGQVYNITFLCHTLQTINLKIDMIAGKIVKEEMRNLMDFKQ